MVATVSISGTIDPSFADARELVHSMADRDGFTNVEWRMFHAVLVEAGRDSVCEHALRENYDWLLMVDADAAPIPPNLVEAMLASAYHVAPDSDALGAYCQLKGGMNSPTIDTGSGTWEEHYPGEGVIPAIRTGAHCLLVKTEALKKFGPPWFRTRRVPRALDSLAEVDNLARCAFHGRNPFGGSEWEQLVEKAKRDATSPVSTVGEDSGFCDALLAAGGKLYVNTDIVVGHVDRKAILPADFIKAMREQRRQFQLAVGVY